MVESIQVSGIEITVIRKRIKHLHLRVRPPNGQVTMSVPRSMALRDVKALAAGRVDWIRKHQARLSAMPARHEPDIQDWHIAQLRERLPPLIAIWEARLQVQVAGYSLRRMVSRWGTCNCRTKHIRLNTELATKPAHLLEYVLVHELVHLLVPNHGPRFVALMDRHYPAWRKARQELNESAFVAR